jgi:hypothetical protein
MSAQPIRRLEREALDAMYAYFLASEGAGETHVLLAGARMRITAKVYGRARDEIERALRSEAPTETNRRAELAAMTALPLVDQGEPEGSE